MSSYRYERVAGRPSGVVQRVDQDGRVIGYAARVTVDGVRRWIATRTPAEAEVVLERVARGESLTPQVAVAPPRSSTVIALVRAYAAKFPSDTYTQQRAGGAQRWPTCLRDAAAAELLPADVRDATREWARTTVGTTARQHLSFLRRVLADARERGLVPPHDPTAGIRAVAVPGREVHPLTPAEYRIYVTACPPWLRPVIVFGVATGLRISNLRGLRWGYVGAEVLTLPASATKTRRTYRIPLSPAARAVLESVRAGHHQPDEFVFTGAHGQPLRRETLRWHMDRVGAATGIRITPHDLRRTAATWAAEGGADLVAIRDLLQHTSTRVTERYIRSRSLAAVAASAVSEVVSGVGSGARK